MNAESKETKSQATLNSAENASKPSKIKKQYIIGGLAIAVIITTLSVVLWHFYGRPKASSTESQASGSSSESPINTANVRMGNQWVAREIFSGTGLPPFPISMNPQACQRPTDRTILQPPDKFTYIGFHLDFSKETPLNITRRLQFHAPSVMYALYYLLKKCIHRFWRY